MYTVYLKMYKGVENVPQPVMFMIFTIFFNGLWSKPFPENETTVGGFFINSKNSVPVQFMHQTESYYYAYAPELDAKMIRLPYSVRYFCFSIDSLKCIQSSFSFLNSGRQIFHDHYLAKPSRWY